MTKDTILQSIIAALTADLATLTAAARGAHAAATHEECIPDNKYDTTALEASYVAQGQANRAADIRRALERYRSLALRPFDEETPIRLTALVTLESEDVRRQVFIGPDAGGLKIGEGDSECIVITPESPLGRALLGRVCDDEIEVEQGEDRKSYTVVSVARSSEIALRISRSRPGARGKRKGSWPSAGAAGRPGRGGPPWW